MHPTVPYPSQSGHAVEREPATKKLAAVHALRHAWLRPALPKLRFD